MEGKRMERRCGTYHGEWLMGFIQFIHLHGMYLKGKVGKGTILTRIHRYLFSFQFNPRLSCNTSPKTKPKINTQRGGRI